MVGNAVIMFDLDGTLSDSAPGILGSLRHAFDVNGVPRLDPQVERALLGPPFYESLPPLIGAAALPDVIAAYRDHYGRVGMYETSVYPCIREVLAGLRAQEARLAVATSKPETYAVPIVEYLGLTEFFETIGGDDLDGSLRTKALVIGKVLARLGEPAPTDVLMVGDRVHDVEGARAHGIRTIGAGWGYEMPGELAAAKPFRICDAPADLATVLGVDGADAEAS
jgi:phosphoglycolate phosphatase